MRTILPVALLLLSACSLGGRMPGAATPPAPTHGLSRSTLERAIGTGRVAIDSAARSGDFEVMLTHFDRSATIEVDGTIGRGADAFAAHLHRIADGEVIHRVQLIPARFQHCSDGAAESGGELLVATLADTVITPYSARWIADHAGVRLQRLTIGDQAERAARREVCPSRAVGELSQRRVTLWALPPYASAVHWKNGGDFQQVLERMGYGDGRIETMARSEHYRGTTKEALMKVGAAGMRVRLVGQFAAEAHGTLKPTQSTTMGRLTTGESHIGLKHTGSLFGAGLSHEFRRVRVGAGPVFMRSEWALRETAFIRQSGTSFGQPTTWFVMDSVGVQDWTSKERGVAIGVDYDMPLSRFFIVNVRGQYRGMASTEIRTTHFDPPTVSLGGYTIGTSFGLTF